jgi:glycerophosphoryl diester phosphodiesterase
VTRQKSFRQKGGIFSCLATMQRRFSLFLVFLPYQFAHSLEIHGHRGARARFPENTLPSLKHALEVGVDVLEFDCGITRDGVVILSHDRRLNSEICLGPGGMKLSQGPLIKDLTYEETQKFDCGALANPTYPKMLPQPGTPPPTLDSVLEWLNTSVHPRARIVQINVETKIDPAYPEDTVDPEKFTEVIITTFQRRKFLDRAILQSFDERTLTIAKKIAPTLRLAGLTQKFFRNSPRWVERLGFSILSPRFNLVSNRMVEDVHMQGRKIIPWTVNTPEQWARLVNRGVDGIITDDPEALINWAKARGLRN